MRSPEGSFEYFETTPDTISAEEGGHPEGLTAEGFRDELRNAAAEMYASPDSLARAIGEKLLIKVDVKERAERMAADMVSGADDVTTRQELKMLGIFIVREQRARFTYDDPATGFVVREDEDLLDLHLPPVPKGMRSATTVRDSFGKIAEYVRFHGLNPKYIMGITYERMGRLAERQFGFNLIEVNPNLLPEDVVRGVANVYNNTGLAGDMGTPVVIYQDTQVFLEQYSS